MLLRLGVINQGEIIVVDETKELLKKMGHKKLTVDLQNEINEIPVIIFCKIYFKLMF